MTALPEPARAPAVQTLTFRDRHGPLLHLSEQDLRGLRWVKLRAQVWRNSLRRRRKYAVPRGAAYTPEEGALIEALTGLEREAGRLLGYSTKGGQEVQ